ncbi:MAG TPA: DUF3089 domain-containing protein, partial [Solirubrobacteraceae bacterium]|nr:DUF3089 domain-containing protein [Solirubrobacteraceae bacterium]
PCTAPLTATVIGAAGRQGVLHARPAANPPIDCFYVYPTVSDQLTANASLAIDPQERAVAIAQASRFSQVCRVYAPVYRQITLAALLNPAKLTLKEALTAYNSLQSGFESYLHDYNHGRGIVFIGHSQGATVLINLLMQRVDQNPALRHRLVSALLMGGNVTVGPGGDFPYIPPCSAATQTGCVVAYSSFFTEPPAGAYFGRTMSALDPFAQNPPTTHILCVNPASPAGGTAPLDTYAPTADSGAKAATPWVAYPGEYTARCERRDGASWLEVERPGGSADVRPAVSESEGPDWGLHVYDVNLALGNLVDLVRTQAAAYARGSAPAR